jgi:pimeloyl-ACP methyl ester carboxylesterase
MCDTKITDRYRVIAIDLPWHGKSNQPEGWQEEEYQLDIKNYKDLVRAFSQAMALINPVVMG